MRIIGTDADEILNGTKGSDIIDGMGGNDTINAGAGADIIRLTHWQDPSTTIDGGAGLDTLAVHTGGRPSAAYYLTALTNVETVAFHGAAGQSLAISWELASEASSTGITAGLVPQNLIGSAAQDRLDIRLPIFSRPETVWTIPDMTVSNWDLEYVSYPDFTDSVGMIQVEFTASDYVMQTSETNGLAGIFQVLESSNGSDTLIGSSGQEFLAAGDGFNTVSGKGGDDFILIENSGTPYVNHNQINGGAGTDTLIVRGHIDFSGSLKSLERITLETGYNPYTGESEAGTLTLEGYFTYVTRLTKLTLDGAGSIHFIALANFDAGDFRFAAASDVTVELSGTNLGNRLAGSSGHDQLIGLDGNDTLIGRGGVDELHGGAGRDILSGGAGADTFVFDTAPETSAMRDVITAFSHSQSDKIAFSRAAFAALDIGPLAAEAFYTGAGVRSAHDADDRIIYNTTTGILFYDADGAGGATSVAIAELGTTTHPALTAADLLIIA